MDPEQLKQLSDLGKELQDGFAKLKEAQDKLKTDTADSVKGEITRLETLVADKLKAVQDKQSEISAALERVGTPVETDEAKENAAKLQRRNAFEKFLREKGSKSALSDMERKALSTDSLDNGGYLVPIENLGIINGRIFETSPMRQIANIVSTSAKSIEVIIDDQEASASWVGEGDTISETNTPTIARKEISAHKAMAYPKMTEEMAADAAFDVQAWLNAKVSDKISRLENTAFVSGNGVSAPRGFLTYTTAAASASSYTYVRNQLEYVPMGSTSAPTENGLIALQGSLKEGYQARAVWVMKRATFVAIMQLAGSSNYRFLNLQPAATSAGQVLPPQIMLFGKPVVLMDDMPAIASNALSIAYGDFSAGYTVVDRVGISVRADPITAPGFIKYYATKRTGGDVTNFEAIKIGKMATS